MGTGRVGDRGGVPSNALRPRRIISKFLQRTHAGEMLGAKILTLAGRDHQREHLIPGSLLWAAVCRSSHPPSPSGRKSLQQFASEIRRMSEGANVATGQLDEVTAKFFAQLDVDPIARVTGRLPSDRQYNPVGM